jgi:Kef-type K+ transport system membrane component KefB
MVEVIGYATEVINNAIAHLHSLPASEAIIFDLALILILCTVFAFIARGLRQPLIPAYVLAGVVIGPLVFGLINDSDLINAFSEIGIAFLLFTAGLEISFQKIKEANLKKIAIIGILQVTVIFAISLLCAEFFDLTNMQAAYLGVILAFGSTMVDVKLLADRSELVTLHGRLVLGILLLQDLIAIVAIVFFTGGGFDVLLLNIAFAKLGMILLLAFLLQRFVLNHLFNFAARSNEFLFLCSLAVLFFFIMLAYLFELSIVIGAFIAGVSLANSPFKIELESRVSPLRDFFAILFFVALGIQLVFDGVGERLILLSGLFIGALILKPLITLILLRITGYQPRTSFLTSICLAQLSEFSLIIGSIGVATGVLDVSLFSTIILVTIFTMSFTPYLINYKTGLYTFFRYPIRSLKFLPIHEILTYEDRKPKETLLIGSHRMGGALMEELLANREKLLVVDYNPEVIGVLMRKKIACVYGDICSPEMLDKINLKDLKLIVSTIPDYEQTTYLLKKLKKASPKARVVVTGSRISETLKLYELGADYVVTPKILAGQKLVHILHNRREGDLKKARKKHLGHLRDIHNLLY